MPRKYAMFDVNGVRTAHLVEGINDIPESAIPLSESLYMQMTQETDGQWVINQGLISKVPLPADPPLILTRERVESLRLRAYAEPLTGSDRYFAEAQRMQIMGEDQWEVVSASGVARYKEIQARYPWPPVTVFEHD
ncbi:HAD family hydrolase [Pseudomonas sp. IT-P12]|jgi:hypothetical protein|uniref:hypothetical protein n=1 Tax=Pseudomonas sp. IT-P12 TaxID=3026450 RepID=UPI0039E15280